MITDPGIDADLGGTVGGRSRQHAEPDTQPDRGLAGHPGELAGPHHGHQGGIPGAVISHGGSLRGPPPGGAARHLDSDLTFEAGFLITALVCLGWHAADRMLEGRSDLVTASVK